MDTCKQNRRERYFVVVVVKYINNNNNNKTYVFKCTRRFVSALIEISCGFSFCFRFFMVHFHFDSIRIFLLLLFAILLNKFHVRICNCLLNFFFFWFYSICTGKCISFSHNKKTFKRRNFRLLCYNGKVVVPQTSIKYANTPQSISDKNSPQ